MSALLAGDRVVYHEGTGQGWPSRKEEMRGTAHTVVDGVAVEVRLDSGNVYSPVAPGRWRRSAQAPGGGPTNPASPAADRPPLLRLDAEVEAVCAAAR